jgi:hypothetical protein
MAQCMKMLVLVLGMAAMLRAQAPMARGECSDSTLPHSARKYIGRIVTNSKEPVVVCVIRFSDFGCELCLNAFLDFCDSLRSGRSRLGRGRVEIFFTRDETPEAYQETTMREWLKGNGIDFPLHIIPSKYLAAERFDHSITYLMGKGGRIEYCGLIPLPLSLQATILKHLFSG